MGITRFVNVGVVLMDTERILEPQTVRVSVPGKIREPAGLSV
jgi:hypothetical protein